MAQAISEFRGEPAIRLAFLEGLIAGALLLLSPSEPENAIWLGLSIRRMALLVAVLLVLIGLAVALRAVRDANPPPAYRAVMGALQREGAFEWTLAVLFGTFWLAANVTLLSISPLAQYGGRIRLVFERAGPIVFWIVLASAQFALALAASRKERLRQSWVRSRSGLVLASTLALTISYLLLGYMLFNTHLRWRLHPDHLALYPIPLAAMAATAAAAWQERLPVRDPATGAIRRLLRSLAVLGWILTIYLGSSLLLGRFYTPSKAYFHLLAEAILQGRLYLQDPPATHDLALFQGNWYVVHPPLVALLLIPAVLFVGAQGINTVFASAVLAASGVAAAYLLLEEMSSRQWIETTPGDNLWLAALLGLGMGLWWVALDGQFWFLSQVAVVALVALASILCVRGAHPFVVGATLGMAVLARPTSALLFPFLFGLMAQTLRDGGTPDRIRVLLRWSMVCLAGIALGFVGMMAYNAGRFGSAFDTGFYRQNIAAWLASDLRQFGLFHPHYLLRNLRVLLVGLPELDSACLAGIDPSEEGMSLLLTTPALLFLARLRDRSPWILGAWTAIGISTAAMLLFYNTGAWQYGYRYILDFAVPLVTLLAAASGRRMARAMKLAIVASIIMGAVGVAWWFDVWCG